MPVQIQSFQSRAAILSDFKINERVKPICESDLIVSLLQETNIFRQHLSSLFMHACKNTHITYRYNILILNNVR